MELHPDAFHPTACCDPQIRASHDADNNFVSVPRDLWLNVTVLHRRMLLLVTELFQRSESQRHSDAVMIKELRQWRNAKLAESQQTECAVGLEDGTEDFEGPSSSLLTELLCETRLALCAGVSLMEEMTASSRAGDRQQRSSGTHAVDEEGGSEREGVNPPPRSSSFQSPSLSTNNHKAITGASGGAVGGQCRRMDLGDDSVSIVMVDSERASPSFVGSHTSNTPPPPPRPAPITLPCEAAKQYLQVPAVELCGSSSSGSDCDGDHPPRRRASHTVVGVSAEAALRDTLPPMAPTLPAVAVEHDGCADRNPLIVSIPPHHIPVSEVTTSSATDPYAPSTEELSPVMTYRSAPSFYTIAERASSLSRAGSMSHLNQPLNMGSFTRMPAQQRPHDTIPTPVRHILSPETWSPVTVGLTKRAATASRSTTVDGSHSVVLRQSTSSPYSANTATSQLASPSSITLSHFQRSDPAVQSSHRVSNREPNAADTSYSTSMSNNLTRTSLASRHIPSAQELLERLRS